MALSNKPAARLPVSTCMTLLRRSSWRSSRKGKSRLNTSDSAESTLEHGFCERSVGGRPLVPHSYRDRSVHTRVRVFKTFTADLERLVDWLMARGITTVAMESTGVYWIALYQMLEDRGVLACLVNARHMKNVPGRRTDWHECQWLQYLHAAGLLRAAFRPEQDVCGVRTLLRHRNELVRMAVQHVQHMQKALTQMNVHIHHVISDITGLTGLAIVDAILSGERDVAKLAELRHPSIQADEETIRKSLEVTGVKNICSH
jgi:transposase